MLLILSYKEIIKSSFISTATLLVKNKKQTKKTTFLCTLKELQIIGHLSLAFMKVFLIKVISFRNQKYIYINALSETHRKNGQCSYKEKVHFNDLQGSKYLSHRPLLWLEACSHTFPHYSYSKKADLATVLHTKIHCYTCSTLTGILLLSFPLGNYSITPLFHFSL